MGGGGSSGGASGGASSIPCQWCGVVVWCGAMGGGGTSSSVL